MQNIIDAIVPIFVFIAVVSGIINSIREAAAKNARPVPQPAQQSRAKAEIEAFLTGAKTPNARPQNSVESPDESQRSRANPKPKAPKRQKQGAASGGRSKSPANMGSGVSEHVDSFIGDHVRSHMGRDVDAFVNMDIAERVKSHLGSQSSSPQEIVSTVAGSQEATDLLALLKTKAGVKNAILVNEILSRPRSLRHR